MHTMYANLTKTQALTLAIRISSVSRFKQFHSSCPQLLLYSSYLKPLQNPIRGFGPRSRRSFSTVTAAYLPIRNPVESAERGNKVRSFSKTSGFRIRNSVQLCPSLRARNFSSSLFPRGAAARSVSVENEDSLPWLASSGVKKVKASDMATAKSKGRLSERANRLEKAGKTGGKMSSWEVSAEKFLGEGGKAPFGNKENETEVMDDVDRRRDGSRAGYEGVEEEEDQDIEEVDDPRWNKIRSKFTGIVDAVEKPEVRRWNKQETWGRKTWKEATQPTVPKMVGEGVYGVGPVLAALSARRREFFALYVQEGLDLSNNSRKRKDKKGFEKVLRLAEKIGLSIKEATKHDLNMIVDNRPHQGLVLDASSLEMVKIKELDPVSDEDNGSLWVALDEVMDPQNLGAIIRSAYFFGASGVVLCAKNSAPLSGVVSKASAGSLEVMELRYCKNMMQFLASSANNGWRILGGSVSSKAIPLNEVLPGAPTIVVLGSEGTGLRPLVERSCTQLIRVPGNIPVDATVIVDDSEAEEKDFSCSGEEFRSFIAVESLNVSVAAGILFHHLTGNSYKEVGHAGDKLTDAIG